MSCALVARRASMQPACNPGTVRLPGQRASQPVALVQTCSLVVGIDSKASPRKPASKGTHIVKLVFVRGNNIEEPRQRRSVALSAAAAAGRIMLWHGMLGIHDALLLPQRALSPTDELLCAAPLPPPSPPLKPAPLYSI